MCKKYISRELYVKLEHAGYIADIGTPHSETEIYNTTIN